MAKKPEILHEQRSVEYDKDHWTLLEGLRSRALLIMEALESAGVRSFVYGSVARGDVTRNSDVDIVVPYTISSYKVEVALTGVVRRELAQATPSMVLKAHIYLENDTCVSFPLFKMRPRELEFYKWGGQVGVEEIQNGVRVHGVDKRLLLIEPTAAGHIESGVVGHESEVAKRLGVGIGIAQERVRVLMRRDSIGRTGIYRTHVLSQTESFEEVAKTLRDTDPALRRTVLRREK